MADEDPIVARAKDALERLSHDEQARWLAAADVTRLQAIHDALRAERA